MHPRPLADTRFRASLALLLAAAALATAGAAAAQIDLRPGNRLGVPRAPEFVALGNLDADAALEAVVLSPTSDVLSLFDASPAGVLTRTFGLPLGRRLAGVQVRDFDGDGLHDVLVADASGGAQAGDLLLLRGSGDGSLPATPEAVRLPVSALRSFASGDFDGIHGPDAVVVTGTRDEVAVLLNDGGGGFVALPVLTLANNPRLVRVARVDASGRDSLLILNTTSGGSEEIVVLRLDDGVLGQPGASLRILGPAPVDFVTGDFNRDGAADIAVLHGQQNLAFRVTTFLNQTVAAPGGSEPTGNWTALPQLELDCPATASGDLTRCLPQALASGDFDRDGFADLAVAFSRPAEVLYLNGIGAGEFDVAGRFVDAGSDAPLTLAAGDMSGNLAADLFIGDTGNDTAILLRSNAPTPQGDGADCRRGNECASQVCLDGVCCRFLTCPSGQRCDVPGSEGTCAPLAANGSLCGDGTTCASGYCVDGVCCANPGCPGGQTCARPGSAGICSAAPPTATATPTATRTPLPTTSPTPQPDGRTCSATIQCQSGLCMDGVCCAETCAPDRFCNIFGSLGSCAPRRFVGQPCVADSDCLTLVCGTGGLCAQAASPTPSSTATPTRTPLAAGAPCDAGAADACASGFCTDGVCCAEPACGPGERCDIVDRGGECRLQLPPGAACARDTDCRGGGLCRFDEAAGGTVCVATDPGPEGCFGDCGDDGAVTVDEILVLIEIALGTRPLAACDRGDIGGDGTISVDELVVAVGLALTGCPQVTPGAATATPPPTGTPTATTAPPSLTPTAIAPTAEPSATPSASPTPEPPTPTATATSVPTVPGLDLSEFDEFRFARVASSGDCPPLDAVFTATITRAGTLYVLDLAVLRAGDPAADVCLEGLVGAGDCPVAVPVSPVPTILTAVEAARLPALFTGLTFSQAPDASCVPAEPGCGRATYVWDGLGAADDACADTNRIARVQADAILAFLEDLRAARASGPR